MKGEKKKGPTRMTGSSSRTKLIKKPYQARVVTGNSGDSMIIKHRELIGERNAVAVSVPTLLHTFQPGNLSWLRAFASRFEYYEVLSATIEVISASSATANGIHSISVDYDVSDLPPADYTSMYNGGNCASASAWKDFNLKIKPQNILPRRKLCTQGFNPPGTDPKLYDSFKIYHYAPSNTYAQYYITYEVRLTVPQIAENVAGIIESTETKTVTGDQKYFTSLKVASDGKVPVGIRKPTPQEVADRGMHADVDLIELAANAAYLLENYGQTATADVAGVNLEKISGVTLTDLRTANMKSSDDLGTCSLMECVTAGQNGLMQLGMNTAQTPDQLKATISRVMRKTLI